MDDLFTISPERAGVPSAAVERFIDRLEAGELRMHALIMLRGGSIFAEGYWAPFDVGFYHRLYSSSKSIVSLAIGIMRGEGRLSLEDKVISFFPDLLPEEVHPYLAAATVRDLLMMATPHNENAYGRRDENWVWEFINRRPSHLPGSAFLYDTAGTVTLNAIVERVSGQNLMDYLRPRLFDPAGISGGAWAIERPEGGVWGGSGIMFTARDFARLALVCLNGGRWGEQQLVPEDYVREATSRQIDNRLPGGDPEAAQGYGYQFWRTRHNGFAMVGMGSQLAICLPEHDFILITNGDTQGTDTAYSLILNALWEEILPHLIKNPSGIPEDGRALGQLAARLASLELYHLPKTRTPNISERVGGRKFTMDDNKMGIKNVRLTFRGEQGSIIYENGRGLNELRFGLGYNIEQPFPEDNYARQIGRPPYKKYTCQCSAMWADDHTLTIYVQITDWYFGSLRMQLSFVGGGVTLMMVKNAEWFLDGYSGLASGR